MEYFHRIQYVAAQRQSQKFTVQIGRNTRKFYRKNSIHVDVLRHLVIQSNFFQYICHVGCAFNLHSIINSGLIPGGQSLSKRQTVFFLLVDPMDKSHEDPDVIDLSVPRRSLVFRKLLGCKTGEVIYEKVYMSPRPPPKISLKHEWKRELGSEHAQRPEVGQLSRSFQSNQPINSKSKS